MHANSKNRYIKRLFFIFFTSLLVLIGAKNLQIKKVFSNSETKPDQQDSFIIKIKDSPRDNNTNISNELKVYSGRHYNTDRSVFQNFSKEFRHTLIIGKTVFYTAIICTL